MRLIHLRLVRLVALLLLPFVATAVLAFLFVPALAFPTPLKPWLTYKGTGSAAEATAYYNSLNASGIAMPPTLSQWKTQYGFTPGAAETRAVYYNEGDLGFGRDMHCRDTPIFVACYVVNHGLGPGGPPHFSVNAAIDGINTIATVAMVYRKDRAGTPNAVSFVVYNADGKRLTQAALDSEGLKNVPHLCLPCHGGKYNDTTHSVTGANFLPFDLTAFQYSQRPGFTRAAQESKFKELNQMVLNTAPDRLIAELITGWYGGPNLPRATQNDSFIAEGYLKSAPELYNTVIKPYCRTCHVAQDKSLASPQEIEPLGRIFVFSSYDMPHAEKTSHNFWNSPAPAFLANNRGWSLQVDRLDDAQGANTCGPAVADCSLRGAIQKANATPGKDIITFAVDGTFLLASCCDDDTNASGDLDITDSLILLGNGPQQTIIDGGGLDRVFHLLNGSDVVIQGVTIQGGDPAFALNKVGGAIYNQSSRLTLNNSMVINNPGSPSRLGPLFGGGIASEDGAITEINNSTIAGNHAFSGGGIYNSGSTLTINNSTVSGNKANIGGGIRNAGSIFGTAALTINHSTITLNTATNTISGAGGIDNSGFDTFKGIVTLQNSIVAGNSAARAGETDCRQSLEAAQYISLSYNLIGNGDGCTIAAKTGDMIGTSSNPVQPRLGPLQENSGPTLTHAPLSGSPAIDAIPLGSNCSPPSYDQRNLARPLDGDYNGSIQCDIGALELVDTTPPTCDFSLQQGRPPHVRILVQDTGSGLAKVEVLKHINITLVNFQFTPGTTQPVFLRGAFVDGTAWGGIRLRVTDVAGNVTICQKIFR